MQTENTFKLNLKYRRLKKNYTQQYMADVLHLTRSAYSKWESGTCEPKASMVPIIAETLEITTDKLFDKSTTPAMVKELEEYIFNEANKNKIICEKVKKEIPLYAQFS